MADPAPTTQRRVPVGYRFCPTEEELIYYLCHKLMARHPSIYNTIPEIDVCKYEPWELLARAASAFPETDQDDSEFYFFSRYNYKYSNSNRLNRTTSLGFWKPTGKDREIKDSDTNNVIGIKKNLVFYEGRAPHEIRSNWVIHEYHIDNNMFPPKQRTYVVCKLKKKYEKKTNKKSNDLEHESFGYENQANFSIPPKEHYFSNMNPMIQTSSYPEVMNSTIQTYFQPNEGEDSIIQTPYLSNEAIDYSMIQAPYYQSSEVLPPELEPIKETPLDFDYEDIYYS